jgi:WD40 repeat protein
MADNNPRINPYIGPRAFSTGEKLYGRDRELRELLNFLLSQRIVLLYSPSGAGKTSLVQAGLIPSLQSRGFSILPVIRVNLDPTPAGGSDQPAGQGESPAFNRYVYSALLSLEEGLPEAQQTPAEELTRLTFEEYLERRPRQVPASPSEQPVVEALVFDQFEEILTIDPTDQASKADFFSQVGDALSNRHRWALFSMREDYIAPLDPFLRTIPTHLSNRYRLDLLGVEAARQAILSPVRDTGVDFTEEAAMKLVDDLRRVQVQRPDGSLETQPGLYVEPVQLQVVCKRLWQNLSPDDQQISAEDVSKIGDVSQSLREYYADEVAGVAAQSGLPERSIREWVNRWLITEQGFRGQVLMSLERSEGLDNRAIQLLEDAHLVRAERRRGATWFELAHDRLIEPVRHDNTSWLQAHLSPLQRQAALWDDEGRPEDLLFAVQTLTEAQDWASENSQALTPVEREFLQSCEAAARRARREKTTNRLIRLLAVGAFLAALLAVFFGLNMLQANRTITGNVATAGTQAAFNGTMAADNATIAAISMANEQQAELASELANQAHFAAEAARQEAEDQRQIAQENAETAQKNAETADRNAAIAFSRQFAAQALQSLPIQSDLASLLAIEAFLASDTYEARNALLTVLMQKAEGGPQELAVLPPDPNDITGVSFSSDGQRLAWGTSAGAIVVWDYRDRIIDLRAEAGDGGRIVALDWGSDAQTLAYASSNGSIFQLDLQGKSTELFNSNQRISDLAFSPDGRRLAACVGNSLVIWDLPTGTDQRRTYSSPVESLDWSHDGRLLALGLADNTLRVVDQDSLETSFFYQAGEGSLRDYVFSPWQKKLSVAWDPTQTDNHWLAYASQAGKIVLLDTLSGKPSAEVDTGQPIYTLAFARDGSMIVSGGEALMLNLWRVPDLTPMEEISKHNRMVVDLDFSPLSGEAIFASASYDNQVGLFQLAKQQPLIQVSSQSEGMVVGVRFSPDGSAQPISLETVSARIGAYTLKAEPASYALSASGNLLALGYEDGSLEILDLETESPVAEFQVAESPVLALAFRRDNALTFSWCEVQDLSWAQQPLCELNSISLLQIRDGSTELVHQYHTDFIRALAIDLSYTLLASGSDDRSILISNLRTGEALGLPISNLQAGVAGLAFGPDRRLLASVNADRTLTLWDSTTNRPIGQPFTGFSARITSLAFAPDGLALYTGLEDGSLLRLDIDPNSWIERNCEMAGRNLSEEEWNQFYLPGTYRKSCAQYP